MVSLTKRNMPNLAGRARAEDPTLFRLGSISKSPAIGYTRLDDIAYPVVIIGYVTINHRGPRVMASGRAKRRAFGAYCITLLLAPPGAHAVEIPGVHAVAFDQPQINAALARPGESTPIDNGLLGGFNFKAFLDTGASGVILDPFYASSITGYGLPSYVYDSTVVVFSDVAVGGGVDYNVSEPLELRLAPFQPFVDLDTPSTFDAVYDQSSGPGRLQIGPIGSASLINVIGMPAMVGKVVVVDPKPVDTWLFDPTQIDQLHTYVYTPGEPFNAASSDTDPGIPVTDRHVQLTLVDVSRFTQTIPGSDPGPPPEPGAESPGLADNPFFGPNPLAQIDTSVPAGSTPGVTVALGALQATGSFLFDTGAAFSFLSQAMAERLNVRYRAGTFGTATPILEEFDPGNPGAQGTALTEQFSLDVSGIGGTVTVAGFQLDSMLLRTVEGDPANPADPNHLRFVDVPVIVNDVSLADPNPAPGTGAELTLDGVFGMNMLVASAEVDLSNPLFPTIIDLRLSPFDWLVFDEPNALLGVKLGPSVDDDADDDGIRDALDICPLDADADQVDMDGDGEGNVCDSDLDGDGQLNDVDADDDNDGVIDINDNCPVHANANQADLDMDGEGNVCDEDDDGDGVPDVADSDSDNDGMSDEFENNNNLDPLDPNDADEDLDNDGSNNLGEANAGTDINLPDTDYDGIGDNLDRSPLSSNNACSLAESIFMDVVYPGEDITCAADTSIIVGPTAEVRGTGHLELITPTIKIQSGFKMDNAGTLTIQSTHPCTSCP